MYIGILGKYGLGFGNFSTPGYEKMNLSKGNRSGSLRSPKYLVLRPDKSFHVLGRAKRAPLSQKKVYNFYSLIYSVKRWCEKMV
jgi:hypothetical protein